MLSKKLQFIGHILDAGSQGPCSFSHSWSAPQAITYVRHAWRPEM